MDGLVADLFGRKATVDAGNTSGPIECAYGEEQVMGWVQDALSGNTNNSTAGRDGVGYKLIKAVQDIRLGKEVLWENVAALRGGYIPDRWRNMWVVLIPKPGRDLTKTKNWWPLNLINCVGKLSEKVVAGRTQEERESVLHHQQFGLVSRRSAVDVLYKSVIEARKCLAGMGLVGWAFWDVKGGFHNVSSADVPARMPGCGPQWCWKT